MERNKSRFGEEVTISLLQCSNSQTPGFFCLFRNPAFDSRYKFVPKDALPLSEVIYNP
jgi:hypothetical protein